MARSKERRAAHRNLDSYIDWLIDNPKTHGDGLTDTDGWLLSVDQDAAIAAAAERRATEVGHE